MSAAYDRRHVREGRRILTALATSALSLFVLAGCHDSEADQRAIKRAFAYDRSVRDHVQNGMSFSEWFFGASEDSVAAYVRNLKRVPLDDCPGDFAEAYRRHISAWDNRNREQIQSTWIDLLAVAKLYNVEHQ